MTARVGTLLAVAFASTAAALAEVPASDARNTAIRHTDMQYTLGDFTRDEWILRADSLRKQVLFASGLFPMPRRTDLNPRMGREFAHEDYSVTSVLLETYPGFYLGGNLYRPAGGGGPFPAVVSPHGHWRYGRFENSEINSVPARAISLARQGYVVFAYDMVGWNDTMQAPHGFAGPREELWLFGTLGLQLWNSLRVVDYLVSLDDVDPARIGVTGASGGGTQAFLLAAVDDRIGYSAPVNMVSFSMQGGSPCENAPLLRVGTNNVEIAALFAPKPQLLVSATGDWTVNVPRQEFPALQRIYRLLDAESNVDWRQFDSPHNYHQDSREAVYGFFGRHILHETDASLLEERRSSPEQLSSLLYLWGRDLPEGAVSFEELVRQRITASEADTLALSVQDGTSLEKARSAFGERLRLALLVETPSPDDLVMEKTGSTDMVLGRKGTGDRVPARLLNGESRTALPALVVHEGGVEAAARSEVAKSLARTGSQVLFIDAFQTGAAVTGRDIGAAGRSAERYYHVFNRSDDANRVQDVLTALAYLRRQSGGEAVSLVGIGRAGPWALLAAAIDGKVRSLAVDLDQFDATDDAAYVERLFIPGLRRAGDFRAMAALLSETDTLLHNAHPAFPAGWFRAAFEAAGRDGGLRFSHEEADSSSLVDWIGR